MPPPAAILPRSFRRFPPLHGLIVLLFSGFLAPHAFATPSPAGDGRRSSGELGPRVVEADDRRRFYRDDWRHLVGQRIHLHVEAEVLRHQPEEIAGRDRRPRLRFANRTVALVIDPATPEWRRSARDLTDVAEFCLHGTVRFAPAGARAPAQLDVDDIAPAPGSRRRADRRHPRPRRRQSRVAMGTGRSGGRQPRRHAV